MSVFRLPVRSRRTGTRAEKRAQYLGLNIIETIGDYQIDRSVDGTTFRIYTKRGHLATTYTFATQGAASDHIYEMRKREEAIREKYHVRG